MDIRPIKTKTDCRAALEEVEGLWNAESGKPEGDRVGVLVTAHCGIRGRALSHTGARSNCGYRIHDGTKEPEPSRS